MFIGYRLCETLLIFNHEVLSIGQRKRTVSLCNKSYSVPLSSRAVTNRRSFVGGSTDVPITVTMLGCRKLNATAVWCSTCTQDVSW